MNLRELLTRAAIGAASALLLFAPVSASAQPIVLKTAVPPAVLPQMPGAPPTPVPAAQVPPPAAPVQSDAAALAQDAADYARQNGVSLDEASHRLRAQEGSVAATDLIQQLYKDRLAGIAIEHHPEYRIVVLLTGSQPVADQAVYAGGRTIAITFHTGAGATRDQLVNAIQQHQAEVRAMLPHPPGMGADPRTGELVVMVNGADADRYPPGVLKTKLAALTKVPVRVRVLGRDANMGLSDDMDVGGGTRVVGVNPLDGRRYACTTGFVVTNGVQTGVVTAAHCPDSLAYVDRARHETPMSFIGQWGWGYQDVQVNVSPEALRPLFYADTRKSAARPVTNWRSRKSTRAGDIVCHRGETTGYSCSQVELTDFAPAGDLCGGACLPTWVTATGPVCKGGDSGAPVFNGTTAFGIVKGASYRADGGCIFYYYMSTDYLPPGWSLLRNVITTPADPGLKPAKAADPSRAAS